MRLPVALPALAGLLLAAAPARAEDRDPALAVAIGAATVFAGFVVGGTLIGQTAHAYAINDVPGDTPKNVAGWFAIEGGFVLAPLASHAVVGEWGRGAVFSGVATATTLATLPIFAMTPDAVDHGTLEQQRWMWGLFCGGLATAVVGVIDTAFAPGRAIHVAPAVGGGTTGIVVGGGALRPVAGAIALLVLATTLSACATVPQNRRSHLADPMMSLTDEPLDAARRAKLYDTREGAAGGDGAAAGGGCGCQ